MPEYSDKEYKDFLDTLAESDIVLNDWEARFLESVLRFKVYSPAQKAIIDRLIEQHRDRLKW